MALQLEEVEKEEVMVYLDDLRVSGVTNMFGAGSYIREAFDVSKVDASFLLKEWMETFHLRHPEG